MYCYLFRDGPCVMHRFAATLSCHYLQNTFTGYFSFVAQFVHIVDVFYSSHKANDPTSSRKNSSSESDCYVELSRHHSIFFTHTSLSL